ncbi:MAG: hypothetical protein ACEPOZ_02505 [Marinifilaceae bacterium]
MKKELWFWGVLLFGASLVLSCSDKDNDDNSEEKENIIEENKGKVEEAGLRLLDDVEELANEPGVKVSQHFMKLTENLQVGGISNGSIPVPLVNAIAKIGDIEDFKNFTSSVKLDGTGEEEDYSLQELWNEQGTYTYNYETKEWEYVAGEQGVVFLFPASESDEENNVSLTIIDLQTKLIDEEYVPTAVELVMVKGEQTIVDLFYSAKLISGEDLPQSFDVKLILSDYEFSFNESIINNVTFESAMSLKKAEILILEITLGGEGDFSQAEFQQESTDVFNTANFKINIGTIMMKGEGNLKAIHDGEMNIRNRYEGMPDTYENRREREREMVQLVNNNMSLTLGFSDASETIADVEWVVIEDEASDDIYVDIQMVFPDGSKVDSETYFGQMLDNFLEELTNIENTIES